MEFPTATGGQLGYRTLHQEARLILLYRENSLLWDRRHPEYNRRDRRAQAMEAIANAMGSEFDGFTVKKRIKTLRDYFLKEMKKVETSRKTALFPYVSRWEHYDAWDFLKTAIARDSDVASPLSANNSIAYPVRLQFSDGQLPVTEPTETMILPTLTTTDGSLEASQAPLMPPDRFPVRTTTRSERESPCTLSPPSSLLKKPRLSVNQQSATTNGAPTNHGSDAGHIQPFRFPAAQIIVDSANVARLVPRNVTRALELERDEVLLHDCMRSALRRMCPYQKDLFKLRVEQILFDVKYMNRAVRPHVAHAPESRTAPQE